jgi:glutathione peroxidase
MEVMMFRVVLLTLAMATTSMAQGFFDLSAESISGDVVNLSDYRGKVVLVVNIASQCGFTSQLGDLQKLYEEYKERGFVILGFPSNDFGGQEPLSNEEVKGFCSSNYGVTFPLFAKSSVSGSDKQPVYKFLTEQSEKKFNGDPGWNFVKFLVGKDGKVKDRFSSMTKPLSGSMKKRIEALLAE